MSFVLARLAHLENWRKHMDAQVTRLTADVASLKTAVAAVADKIATLLKAQGGIDPDDEAALVANDVELEAQVTALQALAGPAPSPSAA